MTALTPDLKRNLCAGTAGYLTCVIALMTSFSRLCCWDDSSDSHFSCRGEIGCLISGWESLSQCFNITKPPEEMCTLIRPGSNMELFWIQIISYAWLILPGAIELTKRVCTFWEYLIGSTAPDKLSKTEKSIWIQNNYAFDPGLALITQLNPGLKDLQ